ncbi:hypothetical protein [Endozoicomonas numazuensis]|uniref:Uncharacterized protein n=1 Tax=Endozoicomonas numazuensis TaxID=1137799 RepID=A0A081NEF4_9GAMM|nr:hypothetical protein [Endozoicomonas numazuensis]KEQ16827.1 hypothetical protein GZ78_19360 [Endozoicomonas numazuensis]
MNVNGPGNHSTHLSVLKSHFQSVSDKWKSKWRNRKVAVETQPEKRIRKEAEALTRNMEKELKARSAYVRGQIKKVEKHLLKTTDYRPANGLEWKLNEGLDPEIKRFQEEGSAGVYRDIHLMLSREARQIKKAQERLANKKEEVKETLIKAYLPEEDLISLASVTSQEEAVLLDELKEFLAEEISDEISDEEMAELEALALEELKDERMLDDGDDDELDDIEDMLAEIDKEDSLSLSLSELELLSEIDPELSIPTTTLTDSELQTLMAVGNNVENGEEDEVEKVLKEILSDVRPDTPNRLFTPEELEEMLKDPELNDLIDRLSDAGEDEGIEGTLTFNESSELADIKKKLETLDLSELSVLAKKLQDQVDQESSKLDEAMTLNRLDSKLSDVSDSGDSGYDTELVDDLDELSVSSLKREDLAGILDKQQLSELFDTVIKPVMEKHAEQEDVDALLMQTELRLETKSSLANALKTLSEIPELKDMSRPLVKIAGQAEKGKLPESMAHLERMLDDEMEPLPAETKVESSTFQRKNAMRVKKRKRQPPSPPMIS